MRWISTTGRLRPASLLLMAIQAAAILGLTYVMSEGAGVKGNDLRPAGFFFISICVVVFVTALLAKILEKLSALLRRDKSVKRAR